MRHHLIALLLLLIFGGNLLASPHPCRQAVGAEPNSVQAAPASHGCHGGGVEAPPLDEHQGHGVPASAPVSDGAPDGPCGDEKGGCKHVCHMVAVVGARVALFAVEPQAQMVPSTFDRSLPLFAPPIDHIPLV